MNRSSRLSRAVRALLVLGLLAASFASFFPARQAAAARLRFADTAFERVWTRTDLPVASNQAQRSWYWGPRPGIIVREAFEGIPGNSHLVQYFDKSRMEINDPNGDKNSKWYVTNGLLTVELVSGQMQTGVSKFERRQPANIPLASDTDDANAPTYASFAAVTNGPGGDKPAQNRMNQDVVDVIDRAGTVRQEQARSRAETRIAHYEETTKHNVPRVFWDFLNMRGPVSVSGHSQTEALSDPWTFVTGLPISEAYWARVKIAGKQEDVLIQAFERRVLTYVPGAAPQWQVQMGNIGQHYFSWRYGEPSSLLANSLLTMSNSASYHFGSLMELSAGRSAIPFARQDGDYQAPDRTKVQQIAIDGVTDLVTIGATGYVSNTQTGRAWARINPSEMGSNAGAVDLSALIGVLQYGRNVTKLADETIDGTPTYHLKMTLDPATIPSADGMSYSAAEADLWIAKDTMLFKRMRGNLTLASGAARQGVVIVTVNFGDYGKPLNIRAPI